MAHDLLAGTSPFIAPFVSVWVPDVMYIFHHTGVQHYLSTREEGSKLQIQISKHAKRLGISPKQTQICVLGHDVLFSLRLPVV